jgi:hypothetical protein
VAVWTVVPLTFSQNDGTAPSAKVAVEPSKLVLRVEGAPDVEIACQLEDCDGDTPFDHAALSGALGALKTPDPTLQVVPSAVTPLQTLVYILDAARPHLPKTTVAVSEGNLSAMPHLPHSTESINAQSVSVEVLSLNP